MCLLLYSSTSVKVNGTLLEADSQNIVDVIVSGGGGSSSVTYTAEIGANWVAAETGEYIQTVVVNGILATDNPIVDVVLDTAKNTALSQLEAWSLISKIETSNGSITVTCLEEAPTTAIPIQIKVVSQMGNAIISRRERLKQKKIIENYDFEEKLLPAELKSCTTKYTCFLPNGDVLISGYGEDIGVWHFEKETLSFYKL